MPFSSLKQANWVVCGQLCILTFFFIDKCHHQLAANRRPGNTKCMNSQPVSLRIIYFCVNHSWLSTDCVFSLCRLCIVVLRRRPWGLIDRLSSLSVVHRKLFNSTALTPAAFFESTANLNLVSPTCMKGFCKSKKINVKSISNSIGLLQIYNSVF